MVVLRNKKNVKSPENVKVVPNVPKTTKKVLEITKPKVSEVSKPKPKIPISDDEMLANVTDRFDRLCSSFDAFISVDLKKSDKFKELTKSLYEFNQKTLKDIDLPILAKKKKNQTSGFKPLNSLFVKGFDNEQIWQQLDVFNRPFIDNLAGEVATLSASKSPLTLNIDRKRSAKLVSKDSSKTLKTTSKSILKQTKKQEAPSNSKDKKVKFHEKSLVNNNNKKKNVDFFDLKEMESFLDAEDRKAEQDVVPDEANNDDYIDYFAEIHSDSGGDESDDEEDGGRSKQPMYSDFFDEPKGDFSMNGDNDVDEEEVEEDDEINEEEDDDDELDSRDIDDAELEMMKNSENRPEDFEKMFANDDDDDEEDEEALMKENEAKAKKVQYDLVNEKLKALAGEDFGADLDQGKSEFEKSQQQLSQKIEKAERELLCPANMRWQTAGETNAGIRPENSLLEEHLQFDSISKPPPMLTDESTLSVEGLIKRRIKDKAFDDVERKLKPKEKPFEFRRRIMLESEKSKVGLAEVYESEFLKQQEAKEKENPTETGAGVGFVAAGEVEENETRREIRRQIRSLFRRLDSLSAFHYTPKQPEPEVRILNNLPAITVEEVTPDAVADMRLLAPEEVFNTRTKKVLQAPGERDNTDRKRARRLKKKKQSIKQKFTNDNQSLNKNNKKMQKTEDTGLKKGLSSSTKFFERLQESKESAKVLQQEKQHKRKPKLSDIPNLAKKLKL